MTHPLESPEKGVRRQCAGIRFQLCCARLEARCFYRFSSMRRLRRVFTEDSIDLMAVRLRYHHTVSTGSCGCDIACLVHRLPGVHSHSSAAYPRTPIVASDGLTE